ncbi:MAG: transporter, family, multidrug resistance protein [Solirubrobacteraceae bacterium]|nr:transporter, family, multidrug resistance protein [Solirubrobacteraceae bacterium]
MVRPESEGTAAAGPAAGRRGTYVLLGALTAFGPLSMDLYLPALPEMARDLPASASAAQLTLTASMIGLALGQLLAGPISDARGRRAPLLAGVAIFALASALCAVAPSIWVLLVLRLLQGMAGAAGISIARAAVRDMSGSGTETARMFARLFLVSGTVPLIAPLAGGFILRLTDWRGVFALLAVIGGALFAAAALKLPETLPPEQRRRSGLRSSLAGMGILLRDGAFRIHALLFGLSFTTVATYLAGATFLLQNVHGLSPAEFGAVAAINGAGLIAGTQISARFVRQHGPIRLMAIGLTIGAVMAVAFFVATLAGAGLEVLLPCLFVLISSRGLVGPNAQALALADHPEVAGTAAGLVGVAQFGAGALAAPLVGLGGTHATVPMAAILAGTAVAAALLAAFRGSGRAVSG